MVDYKIQISIKNVGNRTYPGGYLRFRIKTPIAHIYHTGLDRDVREIGSNINLIIEDVIDFYSTCDVSTENEELQIIEDSITVELLNDDLNLNNNKCIGQVFYKTENSQPTYSQIRHTMKEIKSYIEFSLDPEVLNEIPEVFQERLGWVYDFSTKLYEIKRAIISLADGANEEEIDISEERDLMIDWINRFNKYLEDINIIKFEEMIDNSSNMLDYMNDTIIKLKDNEIDLKFIDMAESISVLINETIIWIEEKHWEDAITVKGDISGKNFLRKFEKKLVFILCENFADRCIKNYSFELDLETFNEDDRDIHNCEISAFTLFYKEVISPEITSMVFSGGTLVHDINFDTRLKGREDNLKNLFVIWLFFIL